jgi:predicted nucleic acid-binding protein
VGINPLRVYFDACIAIYLVEQNQPFAPLIKARLLEQAQSAEVIIQASGLTELECLVLPLKKQDQL